MPSSWFAAFPLPSTVSLDLLACSAASGMSLDSAADSTNLGWKIFKEKYSKNIQKKDLNLLHVGKYLHSTYMVFGISSYLEMIFKIQEDVGRLYVNPTPYI